MDTTNVEEIKIEPVQVCNSPSDQAQMTNAQDPKEIGGNENKAYDSNSKVELKELEEKTPQPSPRDNENPRRDNANARMGTRVARANLIIAESLKAARDSRDQDRANFQESVQWKFYLNREMLKAFGTPKKGIIFITGDKAYVDYIFNFGPLVVYKKGWIPIYEKGDIIANSDDQLLLKVVRGVAGKDEGEVTGMKLIWSAIEAVIPVVDTRFKEGHTDIIRRVKQHYRRFMPDEVDLDAKIAAACNSQKFLDMSRAYWTGYTGNWRQRTEDRISHTAGYQGLTLPQYILKKYLWVRLNIPWWGERVVVARKLDIIFRLGMTGSVLCLAWAGLTIVGFKRVIRIITVGALAASQLPTYEYEDALRLVDDDLHKRSLSMIPCANIKYLHKLVNHKRIPEVQLPDNVSYVTVPPEVDESIVEQKVTEAYGTHIPYPMVVPSTNPQNLRAAVNMRMGQDNGPLDQVLVSEFETFCFDYIDKMAEFNYSDTGREAWYKGQYGELRAAQLIAAWNIVLGGNDRSYKMFVKAETYPSKTEEDFKPRMIFSPTDPLLASFSFFFSQLTRWFKETWNSDADICFSSGDTPDKAGMWWQKGSGMLWHGEADVSSWDGSLREHFKRVELYLLKKKCNWDSEKFEWLQANWMYARGTTRDGSMEVEFKDHARQSGDPWTGTLNSFLNVMLQLFTLKHRQCPDGDLRVAVCGDDGETQASWHVDTAKMRADYKGLGMKLEVVERTDPLDATYCSGWYLPVDGVWRWQLLPFRSFSKMGTNHSRQSRKAYKGLMVDTCMSLMSVLSATPVFGTFLRTIINTADELGVKRIKNLDGRWNGAIQGGVNIFPCIDTYQRCAQVWGTTVEELLTMERWIEQNVTIALCPYILDDAFFVEGLRQELGAVGDPENIEKYIGQIDTAVEIVCQQFVEDIIPHHVGAIKKIRRDNQWPGGNYGKPKNNKSYYDLICVQIPLLEEKEKLRGCKSLSEALTKARVFGASEDEDFGTSSHVYLHQLFTFFSYLNFEWGVELHRSYNRSCFDGLNGRHSDELIFTFERIPCAKGGEKKKKKEKKVVVVEKVVQKKKAPKKEKSQTLGQMMAGGGSSLGRWAGEKIGNFVETFLGFGDYNVEHNSLMNMNGPVQMHKGYAEFRFRHTEYIADILSSTTFDLTAYNISPSNSDLFPWLSGLINMFETFCLDGMVIMYKPLSGSSTSSASVALGYVVAATAYDVNAADFASKREMEATQFCTSCVPFEHMVHPIECAQSKNPEHEFYLTHGSDTVGDLRLNYPAKFQLAVGGCKDTGSVLGELWVCYDVVMRKPRLPVDADEEFLWAHLSAATTTAGNPFGATGQVVEGSLALTTSATDITFPSVAHGYTFLIVVLWKGTSNATVNPGDLTYVNTTPPLSVWGRASTIYQALDTGAVSTNKCLSAYVLTIEDDGIPSIGIADFTLPGGTVSTDVYISRIGVPTAIPVDLAYLAEVEEKEGMSKTMEFSKKLDSLRAVSCNACKVGYKVGHGDHSELCKLVTDFELIDLPA